MRGGKKEHMVNRDYEQACATLREALRFGMDLSLEPISHMCACMGDPQESYACMQVAGTNGKTSTARMSAALVQACAGKTSDGAPDGAPADGTRSGMPAGTSAKVGLYTSPGLTCYNERMELFEGRGGHARAISDDEFSEAVGAAVAAGEEAGVAPTEFELLTAAALWWFAREGADAVVLECGLGGRWDATSVVNPAVAVLTGVGLDHTRVLGDTLEQIAAEKAAIVKPGSTAVLAPGIACRDLFADRAREVGAPVMDASFSDLDLLADQGALSIFPSYQRSNIATACKAAQAFLGAPVAALPQASRALSALSVPGRFECLREDPLLVVDAAHNPQSAAVLAAELAARFEAPAPPNAPAPVVSNAPAPVPPVPAPAASDTSSPAASRRCAAPAPAKPPMPALLLGILADKDAAGIVHELAPLFADIVVTRSASPRALEPHELAAIVAAETGRAPAVAPDVEAALSMLADTPAIACGSVTVAGEVKRLTRSCRP